MLLWVGTFAQIQNTQTTKTSFGRYGSNCSSGRGVCSFSVSNTEARQVILLRSSTKVSDNSFILEIDRKRLSIDEEISIAGKPFSKISQGEIIDFLQLDSLKVDNASILNLKLKVGYDLIIPGKYSMQISDEKVKIVFTLSSG